jgi:broad specificity phosphatase PhoE
VAEPEADADGGVVLLLVRHAEQVRAGDDGELTPLGRRQAAALGRAIRLTGRDRLVSSPLVRARDTAAALGRAPDVVPGLEEFRFGPSWAWDQGERREDLLLWRPEHRLGGGESLLEFGRRVEAALTALLAAPPPGRVVAVVHSGVVDAALRWAWGVPVDAAWVAEAEAPLASVTELRHWPSGRFPGGAPRHTVVVRLGDTAHLAPELRVR